MPAPRRRSASPRKTSPETLHRRAQSHDWDDGTAALRRILQRRGRDRGMEARIAAGAKVQGRSLHLTPLDCAASRGTSRWPRR